MVSMSKNKNSSSSSLCYRTILLLIGIASIAPLSYLFYKSLLWYAPLLMYELSVPYLSDPLITNNIDNGNNMSPRISIGSVGVVLRTFKGYIPHTLSLLWNLESQTVLNYSKDPISIHVMITPTEPEAVIALKEALDKFWYGRAHHINVDLLEPTLAQYSKWATKLPTLCTRGYHKARPATAKRVCGIDNPTHYEVTDMAIRTLLDSHPQLRYLMVTNGDNWYGPLYLEDAVKMMEGVKDEDKLDGNGVSAGNNYAYDCVITDMVHHRRSRTVRPWLGKVDLGASLWRVDFMKSLDMTSFIKVLQKRFNGQVGEGFTGPSAQNYYESDGNYIQEATSRGARVGAVRALNFVHG